MSLSCAGDTKFQLTVLGNARNIRCQPCSVTPRRPTELFVIAISRTAGQRQDAAWNRHAATALLREVVVIPSYRIEVCAMHILRIVSRCVHSGYAGASFRALLL